MTAGKVSRVRIGLGMALAVVFGAGGVVAVPTAVHAAPWSINALSDPAGPTPTQLAQSLVGPGITVNSASFTGDTEAAGTFNDPAASVGLASGVVLSSGRVHDVVGPNENSGTGVDLGQPGDPALDALLPAGSGQTTQDATILTVNFTPTNPQLAVNYVFASEEYEEYVHSPYNDVFAFFVNGNNCALTPGTSAPITINTVNQLDNTLFYVPNTSGTYDTEFDGFTVVLTCRAAVNPGVPNTLRLAIADASDGILDSAVFLQGSGVSSNPLGPLQPITPNRLLDTRLTGVSGGLSTQAVVPGGTSITVKVTGGDVPDAALAVALNVTAVDGAVPGFLTIYPFGADRPNTSSVNYPAGSASPNNVVAKIGNGGQISIFSNATVNVIVDVFGWFGPGGNARLFTVVPDRLIDTRLGAGTPVGTGGTIDVQVTGTTRVPVGASAAVLNVTAVGAILPGYLTVYPSDRDRPLVSAVNYEAGVARPNSVISPIGADGKIKVFASAQTHVIVDVMGWFGTAGQAEYVEVPSTRVLDSRLPQYGAAKMAGNTAIHLQITGAVVPPNARSVALNVTATEPDLPGFLTVYPTGAARPTTSNLNYVAGQTIPNAVIVGLGPTGAVDIFSNASTHVVVDVVGYFA